MKSARLRERFTFPLYDMATWFPGHMYKGKVKLSLSWSYFWSDVQTETQTFSFTFVDRIQSWTELLAFTV